LTTYYVRPSGGSDSNSGLSYALAFATLGKAATSVAAGDTVWVAPGSYFELLTISTSGTIGNVISWIGDYLGTQTDGVGGVVRITGAATNEQSASRADCISATTKNYNSFTGFAFDTCTGNLVLLNTGCTNFTFNQCYFIGAANAAELAVLGAAQANLTVSNCVFIGPASNGSAIGFSHSSTVDNTAHVVSNCVFIGIPGVAATSGAVNSARVGGITVKNCVVVGCGAGVKIGTALTVGQTVTVNNSILYGCGTALQATTTAEFVEDYNSLFGNLTDRTNVSTGTHSNAFPTLLDSRWFFQLAFAGAGPNSTKQVVSPFDLASFSALIDVAGTSPTTTDLRGTAAINSVREWGALEYDSTLNIKNNFIAGGKFVGQGVTRGGLF
jgi:hypothetical protein